MEKRQFAGKSSGTSLSAESYSIPTNVTAKFVRITVNGNTENNWASITELSVDGFSNTLPPPPPFPSPHPSAAHKPATDPIQGRWVGFKAIMYNIEQNGTTSLKEEIWLDPNENGNWVKVNEFTDAGGFGDQGQVYGGKPDQIITWGGPIATFRWDKTTDVDIKDFSIREIQSPQQ